MSEIFVAQQQLPLPSSSSFSSASQQFVLVSVFFLFLILKKKSFSSPPACTTLAQEEEEFVSSSHSDLTSFAFSYRKIPVSIIYLPSSQLLDFCAVVEGTESGESN